MTKILLLLCLTFSLLGGCTRRYQLAEKDFVDTRSTYQQEVEKKISDWREILVNLRNSRNMFPVYSLAYENKGHTIAFLEEKLSEIGSAMTLLRSAKSEAWTDHRAEVDAKLAQMKDLYYRAPSE